MIILRNYLRSQRGLKMKYWLRWPIPEGGNKVDRLYNSSLKSSCAKDLNLHIGRVHRAWGNIN